jgi:hypothetical protein
MEGKRSEYARKETKIRMRQKERMIRANKRFIVKNKRKNGKGEAMKVAETWECGKLDRD